MIHLRQHSQAPIRRKNYLLCRPRARHLAVDETESEGLGTLTWSRGRAAAVAVVSRAALVMALALAAPDQSTIMLSTWNITINLASRPAPTHLLCPISRVVALVIHPLPTFLHRRICIKAVAAPQSRSTILAICNSMTLSRLANETARVTSLASVIPSDHNN